MTLERTSKKGSRDWTWAKWVLGDHSQWSGRGRRRKNYRDLDPEDLEKCNSVVGMRGLQSQINTGNTSVATHCVAFGTWLNIHWSAFSLSFADTSTCLLEICILYELCKVVPGVRKACNKQIFIINYRVDAGVLVRGVEEWTLETLKLESKGEAFI